MHTQVDREAERTGSALAKADQLGTAGAFQLVDHRAETAQLQALSSLANGSARHAPITQLQAAADQYVQQQHAIERAPNHTNLPDQLKSGVENLSGVAMNDVKVHYNSDKPAQLNAHAYAQGTDIHVGPGQEKHLPHEAWHVVQQKQGRVQPTVQMKGDVAVNDDAGLEKEADVMGEKALQMASAEGPPVLSSMSGSPVLQGAFSQVQGTPVQQSLHGGIRSQYDEARNVIELHVNAGANDNGDMMKDMLAALWEARDTLAANTRIPAIPGSVHMHPTGSQVVKQTMEMLGEAIGAGVDQTAARNAKAVRKAADAPMWVDPTGGGAENDIIDATVVPEHAAYRNSMVGQGGITMKPSGGGTSGGTVDMLNGAGAAAERALYDTALLGLRPLSLNVEITTAVLAQIIAMIEGKLTFFQRNFLKAKYKLQG